MNTTPMALVYVDDAGRHHRQPWQDVDTAGPLVDDAGRAMELIGWTTEPH